MSFKEECSDSDNQTLFEEIIKQGATETQPTTSNLAAGWEGENEYEGLDDAEEAFLELMAVSKAGERQEAVLTEGDTGSLPRSTVDMLNKECYDWNEDYFGFKNFSIKEAMISKNMFIKRWEREFAAYTIDGSNWDTHIGEYAKKCEKAFEINKPRGVVEVLKPIILSRVSGEIQDALKLRDLKIDEIVKVFNKYAEENYHPEIIVKDFIKVMSSNHQTLNNKHFATIDKFLEFIESKPKENVLGFLVNMATRKKFQIDFDFFKDNSKDFQSFLKEYKSKAINIKAVKIKIGSHPAFIGRFNKKTGKSDPSNHGLNDGPKFSEVVSFFRNKFAGKRIDNKLFTRMRNRHKKNLCVSCGETRNHNWKTCANVDLKQ